MLISVPLKLINVFRLPAGNPTNVTLKDALGSYLVSLSVFEGEGKAEGQSEAEGGARKTHRAYHVNERTLQVMRTTLFGLQASNFSNDIRSALSGNPSGKLRGKRLLTQIQSDNFASNSSSKIESLTSAIESDFTSILWSASISIIRGVRDASDEEDENVRGGKESANAAERGDTKEYSTKSASASGTKPGVSVKGQLDWDGEDSDESGSDVVEIRGGSRGC
ncbi:hypothetical protein D9758_017691 [Tetrapyrgos nigripes]|uniref:Uncharacterized protein n=1 Tax=Tetrapyrgos nigripes TaxID=182062 RepID=A0A8H5C8E5_9AGAR|nr:hypothetical protein D9758_017691 [Tetrapyrgos nigripes]